MNEIKKENSPAVGLDNSDRAPIREVDPLAVTIANRFIAMGVNAFLVFRVLGDNNGLGNYWFVSTYRNRKGGLRLSADLVSFPYNDKEKRKKAYARLYYIRDGEFANLSAFWEFLKDVKAVFENRARVRGLE